MSRQILAPEGRGCLPYPTGNPPTVPHVGRHRTAQSVETEDGILPTHPRTPLWGPENKNLISTHRARGQGSWAEPETPDAAHSHSDHHLSKLLVRVSKAAISSKQTSGETSSLPRPSNGQCDLTWIPHSTCNSQTVKMNLKVISVLRPLDLVPKHSGRNCQRGRGALTAGWIMLPSLPQIIIHKETKHSKG